MLLISIWTAHAVVAALCRTDGGGTCRRARPTLPCLRVRGLPRRTPLLPQQVSRPRHGIALLDFISPGSLAQLGEPEAPPEALGSRAAASTVRCRGPAALPLLHHATVHGRAPNGRHLLPTHDQRGAHPGLVVAVLEEPTLVGQDENDCFSRSDRATVRRRRRHAPAPVCRSAALRSTRVPNSLAFPGKKKGANAFQPLH